LQELITYESDKYTGENALVNIDGVPAILCYRGDCQRWCDADRVLVWVPNTWLSQGNKVPTTWTEGNCVASQRPGHTPYFLPFGFFPHLNGMTLIEKFKHYLTKDYQP
jgi:hypothetical protein